MTVEKMERDPLRVKLGLDVSEIIDELKRKYPDMPGVDNGAKRLFELINSLMKMRNEDYADNKQAQAIIGGYIFDAQEKLQAKLDIESQRNR